jgi:hypothetical protein
MKILLVKNYVSQHDRKFGMTPKVKVFSYYVPGGNYFVFVKIINV